MISINWQTYRSFQKQGLFFVFDVKKRHFIQVDELGHLIQVLFEKYGEKEGVLGELGRIFDDFDPVTAIKDITEFYSGLNQAFTASPYDYNLNERLAKAFNDFTSLSWAISSKCNLKCKHCRQKPLVELPFKKKLDLIDFIAQNTMIHRITLTGGEPTIHPNIWDLCRYLKRYGFQLLMITNGTSLTNEILNNITRYEIRPVVSLDGTKEIHEGIRGKDSFEKTLRGIKDLENRKIGFNINRVIIPGYDQNEQEFVHLLASFKNIRGISIYRCIPTGKARQSFRYQKNRYYSSLKKLITSFSNSTLKDRIKMHIDDPLIPLHLPKKMLQSTSISYGCLLKDGTISLQPDGSFLACQALPVSIASWNEDLDWDTIKNNPIIKRSYFNEKSLEFFPRECLSCSDFSSCSGGCTAFTFSGGNGITPILLNKKDPYCPKNTYSDL